MLHFLYLLAIFPVLSTATSGTSTSTHTETFNRWKEGTFTDTLFLPDTYVPFLNNVLDRDMACQTLSDNQTELRAQFLEILSQHNITCTGSWCRAGAFACARNSLDSCYHVEHIIDKVNPDPLLLGRNTNIVGNLIMAYGKWNQEIGTLTWVNVVSEKRQIYTPFLYETARNFVLTCGEFDEEDEVVVPITYESSFSLSTSDIVGLIFGGLTIMLMGMAAVCLAKISTHTGTATPPSEEL